MKYADLHTHTIYSDGTFSPKQLVEQAKKVGLSCIGITDHDSVEAIAVALDKAKELDLEIVPGVELSAEIEETEIHILGYYIDWKQEKFLNELKLLRKERIKRMQEMIDRLKKYQIKLDLQEVLSTSGKGAVGRLHLARVMYKQGFVTSIKEAFTKYIGDGKPCYIRKKRLTPYEAISMIKKNDGISVLAHPHLINTDNYIVNLIKYGLKGIEVYYPELSEALSLHYQNLARKFHLFATGGSDSHGQAKENNFLGKIKIPYSWVENLRNEAKR